MARRVANNPAKRNKRFARKGVDSFAVSPFFPRFRFRSRKEKRDGRKVWVEFEGAIYHVMCRGDRPENIFENDADRARFMETLAEACHRTGWRIHSYVLMSNRYIGCSRRRGRTWWLGCGGFRACLRSAMRQNLDAQARNRYHGGSKLKYP
jgi:hypothetical protein